MRRPPVAPGAACHRGRPSADRGDRRTHVPSRAVQHRSALPAGPGGSALPSLGPERVHLDEPDGPRVRRRQAGQCQGLLPAEAGRGPCRGRHHGGGRVGQGHAGRAGPDDRHAARSEGPRHPVDHGQALGWQHPRHEPRRALRLAVPKRHGRPFTGMRRMPGISCLRERFPAEGAPTPPPSSSRSPPANISCSPVTSDSVRGAQVVLSLREWNGLACRRPAGSPRRGHGPPWLPTSRDATTGASKSDPGASMRRQGASRRCPGSTALPEPPAFGATHPACSTLSARRGRPSHDWPAPWVRGWQRAVYRATLA